MDIIAEKHALDSEKFKDKIKANDLSTVLMHYGSKIKVLSLDCFDTLLWRKTALPIDLLYDLQHYPAFKSNKITGIQRATAEALARQIMFVKQGSYEIRLNDLYRLGFPHLNNEQIQALVEDEINAEINTCYAFPPIVELIRQAKANNLKIIIVSNTYLEEHQLRRLLASTLPPDAMQAIELIFCSCDFNKSKGVGLYEKVLQTIGEPAHSFLHIGDNKIADQDAARAVGINALHFIHHESNTEELLRMQHTAATVANPLIRHTRSLASPFRGVFATAEADMKKPETVLGYASLGPIMYSFARLICDDVDKLVQEGKQPKVLFLMRDGYLPSAACKALTNSNFGKQARISRFTATAAGFRTQDDVERFLAEYLSILPFEYICRQLLLTKEMSSHFIKLANAEKYPSYVLCKLILQDKVLKEIFEQSRLFRARLKRYFQDILEVEAGDTVIFVDIGYAGTAQTMLSTFLYEDLGVAELQGRYLMTLNMANWEATRRGLIDPSWCDDRVMAMLSADVSLIEEFCCSGDDSVVDYDTEGTPIFVKSYIDREQLSKIKVI